MATILRKFWRRAPAVALAVVGIAVGCADSSESNSNGGDDDAGAAGEPSGGAGQVASGGTNHGGGNAAGEGGAPAGAGKAGETPEAGGESGSRAEGGAGGTSGAAPGEGGEAGAPPAHQYRCVAETDYCGAEPCVQFSAGCVDHQCLPPLPVGSPCTDHHECESGRCDAGSKMCVDTPQCGCLSELDCAEGEACVPTESGDACYPQKSCEKRGALGVACNGSLECAFGLSCYALSGSSIVRCLPTKNEGEPCSPVAGHQCGPGLDCVIGDFPPDGTCKPHGDACPCRAGFVCGTDDVCHALAKLDESCEAKACDRGLRCAEER